MPTFISELAGSIPSLKSKEKTESIWASVGAWYFS